jgi:hypothetical protein
MISALLALLAAKVAQLVESNGADLFWSPTALFYIHTA